MGFFYCEIGVWGAAAPGAFSNCEICVGGAAAPGGGFKL